MENIRNEFMEIAPDRMQTLTKINRAIHTGTIKEFTIDEQIEMSGVLAEAAAAFYFSETAEKDYLEAVRLDLYETAMDTATSMIKNPIPDKLRLMLDVWQEEDIWEKFENAYIGYYVRKYRQARGLDDMDVIGEYPPAPDENGDDE